MIGKHIVRLGKMVFIASTGTTGMDVVPAVTHLALTFVKYAVRTFKMRHAVAA